MHTQKVFEHHESGSKLHILISELMYMDSSTQLSASSSLCSIDHANVTMIQVRLSISIFPPLLKLSNLRILKLPTYIY
jgi:hypothetical protein